MSQVHIEFLRVVSVLIMAKGQPRFISHWCNSLEETTKATEHCKSVPLPTTDPIQGAGGILVKRWDELMSARV